MNPNIKRATSMLDKVDMFLQRAREALDAGDATSEQKAELATIKSSVDSLKSDLSS